EVAAAALDAGAQIVNDVTALDDSAMADVVASRDAGLVLMHMQGVPRTMQADPHYEDVVEEVAAFLEERAAVAEDAGIRRQAVAIDPGIGFGKTVDHNLSLLANMDRLVGTGRPVVLGTSRKRFLGTLTGVETAAERDPATAATVALAVAAGVAAIRVHNVAMSLQAARTASAIVSI
ncbi:MAG: dihydropteroate synthase, partial [Proteobacteria bacterium]|nr:dihydropteroate synthase [Pseudomonadota bacterium]